MLTKYVNDTQLSFNLGHYLPFPFHSFFYLFSSQSGALKVIYIRESLNYPSTIWRWALLFWNSWNDRKYRSLSAFSVFWNIGMALLIQGYDTCIWFSFANVQTYRIEELTTENTNIFIFKDCLMIWQTSIYPYNTDTIFNAITEKKR